MLEIYGNTTLGVLFKIHAISYSSVKTIISIPQSNAATAAKSLQSRPTLCDSIDGSPPGFPVPGISGKNTGVGCHFLLQCMKVKVKSLSRV